jgi:hypothetical protein
LIPQLRIWNAKTVLNAMAHNNTCGSKRFAVVCLL